MRKRLLHVFLLGSVFSAAGCGDTWPKLVQNELTLQHEFNDALMKIVDDDSAKFYKEFYFEKIKKQWADVQTRKETYLKVHVSNKHALDEFMNEVRAAAQALGGNLGQAADNVMRRWEADDQKRQQVNQIRSLKGRLEEFQIEASPNFQREKATVKKRRVEQLGRIQSILRQLPPDESQNLQKIPEAVGSVFTGSGWN